MKRTAIVTLFLVFTSSVVYPCEGDQMYRYVSSAWTRCIHATVTLKFRGQDNIDKAVGSKGRDYFVTLSQDDAKKLYEQLKQRFDTK
jgi:hypothetical protein